MMHPQHDDDAQIVNAIDQFVPVENGGDGVQTAEQSATNDQPATTEDRADDDDNDFGRNMAMTMTTVGKGMIEAVVSLPQPMMNTYLTDVWQLNFTKTAGIVNVWEGVTMILPIALAHLSDTFFGVHLTYKITAIVYTIGFGFLSMSTPPVLSNLTGTCSDYKSECIGQTQRILYFTSLALIAVGIAGYIFIFGVVLAKIKRNQGPTRGQSQKARAFQKAREFCCKICFHCYIILIAFVVVGIIYSAIKPWSVRFGIGAICSAVQTICLLVNACSPFGQMKEEFNMTSPITTVIRVLVASALKLSKKLPDNPKELYKNGTNTHESLPHTRGLRCLDRAAIVLQNEEPEKHKWRFCTVTEVEETKIAIRMFPMWMTFIICGVITSIGNTYFLEQAKHLNQKIGHLTLPFLFLPVFHKLMKSLIGATCKRLPPRDGIALAMTCSVLCCIIAALVERQRLHIVIHHALLDKPDEKIPMSVLWLLPQFIFLAGLDSLFEKKVEDLFDDQIPPSSRRYLTYFTRGVVGAGIAGGVLSIYIVGNVSERGGRMNWFQGTLNKSRLDKYYWTLAAIGVVNLVFYVLVAIVFPFKKPKQNETPGGIGYAQKYLDDCKCFELL